jgi:hypothetical protein
MDEQTTPVSSAPQYGTSVPDEAAALQHIIAELSPLAPGSQRRLIDTVCTFLGLGAPVLEANPAAAPPRLAVGQRTTPFRFSQDDEEEPSLKQFLLEKSPTTDVERVACLAFYLAHYRATPHIKTKDITALNTEAAQRKFSNTAVAVDNAAKTGYLVPSIKGCKQLSAAGERFVVALPDREAAREIMDRARPSRGGRSSKKATAGNDRE